MKNREAPENKNRDAAKTREFPPCGSALYSEVDVTGKGKGYLFQRGKVIPIEWRFRDGWIVPFKDGKEVGLLPGKTWVNILPETGKVSFR